MFNPLNALLGLFSLDIGIDLGTANTLVSVRGKGIVINEPSVVAIEAKSRRVVAIGLEAKQMVGRTPANIIAIRPLRDGVISDFDVTQKMLVYFIRRVHQQMVLSLPRPRVVVGIPSGCTEVEKRAVYEATLDAGAREAYLIEEPMASAIGANLPVTESVGSMVVDIGGGTTEVAVIALGGIVVSRSIRVAGDEMDEEIMRYAREKSNLLTGLPQSVEVSSVEIREALSGPVHVISETVRSALDETPPELVADLMEHGIALTGGGALLQGLAQRLSEETRMKVYVADEPLTCVAKGAGKVLEELDSLRKVLAATHRDGRWH